MKSVVPITGTVFIKARRILRKTQWYAGYMY
jgi:hypothetical protein